MALGEPDQHARPSMARGKLIVFDIEGVFLFPFAVAFNRLGIFALVEMVLFIVTVFVAYAYVWRRGGLEWD